MAKSALHTNHWDTPGLYSSSNWSTYEAIQRWRNGKNGDKERDTIEIWHWGQTGNEWLKRWAERGVNSVSEKNKRGSLQHSLQWGTQVIWGHRSHSGTVQTQKLPLTALQLRRDLSLGFGPVDGAAGGLETPSHRERHILLGHLMRYTYII